MASTSFTLGPHWETFIREQVASGRYGSASEVVREALRGLEEERDKLEALRAHIDEGVRQANAGMFAPDDAIDKILAEIEAN